MNSNFFDGHDYFIDEKVNLFKFENVYKIFDEKGENIGAVKQILTFGQKALRFLVDKRMLPFKLNIVNNDDELQAVISRGFTFFMSKIIINDAYENPIAIIKQKFKFFKPTFKIEQPDGELIAEITGDWKAWNFVIKDSNQIEMGSISKKWAGALKEIFTTADKYNVHIDPLYSQNKHKVAILSAAITIDMVLKES
ncbi:phospholipid scramblase-related protein [Pedobacter nutrimenti]|uniref:phospholipid scramblase-related protein n=1 Tax=Pedobacter nutrimenti TaxID=1241337 RepID=UPI00292D664E|nr:phospholipid scramblase-related protein [Pedobacter nutrimenti]